MFPYLLYLAVATRVYSRCAETWPVLHFARHTPFCSWRLTDCFLSRYVSDDKRYREFHLPRMNPSHMAGYLSQKVSSICLSEIMALCFFYYKHLWKTVEAEPEKINKNLKYFAERSIHCEKNTKIRLSLSILLEGWVFAVQTFLVFGTSSQTTVP